MTVNRLQSRLWLLAVLAITALLFALPLSAQADESASVRFLHALPGAGPVDVYVDGQLTLVNLEFGAPSLFVQIPAGAHTVTVTQTGVTTALWQQEITPAAGTSLTMVVSTTDPLEFTVFQNDVTPLPEGKARITGIHAIAGGPVVDVVLADGRAVIPGLQYNTPYGTLDVPTGVYELAVVPQGGTVDAALIPVTPVNLNSGTSYQIVAYGTASLPNILVLSAPAAGDASSAGLRVVHGVAGGPAVDLYLNDILIAPSLEFGGSTVFMQLPAGEYDAVLVPAGDPSGAPVASATLTLQAGADVTALAVADPEGVAFQVIPVSDINASAENAVVQVVNLSTANATAVLSGGASVVEATAGQTGDVSLPATGDNLVVSATGADPATIAGPFYGGAEYTVVVVDSGDGPMAFVLPPMSVATSIGSAPGNQTVSLAGEQPTEAPVAPTEAPAPTAAVVEAQPTLAPEVLPTTAPAGGLPTARVLTDPGVNVHLRQFPSSQALSLSLIGSGTNVDVLGREGAPATRPDATATPEGTPEPTPFVDPATLLESPGDDLDPTTTWLFISSVAPDGGTYTGWINALFLAVSAPNGQPQRLADLPLTPRNTAGEYNSSFVPTALPTQPFENQVVATVDQLNPGSNLHLRRNPDPAAESLALIPAGTQVVVEGVNDTGEWYQTTFNGTTGWISVNYVSLTFNGRSFDPVNLSVLATPTPTVTPLPTASA